MTISYARTGPKVSEGRLALAVGAELPADYSDFMLTQNGGVLTETAHLPGDDSGASVRAFLIVDDPEETGGYDVGDYLRTYEGRYPDGFLPIAVDASSNLILLDTGYDHPGSVWFWDHEGEADENEPPRTDNITKIADTFTGFVDRLTTGLSEAEAEYIRRAAAEGTFTPGPYQPDEPFTFGGRRLNG